MDKRLRFMTDLFEPLIVEPGTAVKLSRDHDPGYTGQVARQQAVALLADGVDLLSLCRSNIKLCGLSCGYAARRGRQR
jgi:hypothetical protein